MRLPPPSISRRSRWSTAAWMSCGWEWRPTRHTPLGSGSLDDHATASRAARAAPISLLEQSASNAVRVWPTAPPRQYSGGAAEGRSGPRGTPVGSRSLTGHAAASLIAQRRWGCDFHSSTPAFSQDMRRWTPRLGIAPAVAEYEVCQWPWLTPVMSCVTLRPCIGAGIVAQGRVGRDWVG